MMATFTITTETVHHIADGQCPTCLEEYPEPCRCGGLVHGELGEEQDTDGNFLVATRCDRCGRNEDQLDEV